MRKNGEGQVRKKRRMMRKNAEGKRKLNKRRKTI